MRILCFLGFRIYAYCVMSDLNEVKCQNYDEIHIHFVRESDTHTGHTQGQVLAQMIGIFSHRDPLAQNDALTNERCYKHEKQRFVGCLQKFTDFGQGKICYYHKY